MLLDAVCQLRAEFPQVSVRVAAAPWDEHRGYGFYGRYLKALIDRRRLGDIVTPLSALSAQQVAEELARAAAFVIPSFIENSPNSLAEAMLVGTPCVTSLVGGVPSMVEDGKSALGFQSGDSPCLAHCLRRLFASDALSDDLSAKARSLAATRHNQKVVVERQFETYRAIAAQK